MTTAPIQSVILAGGRGTRLARLGNALPKHLLPVAGRTFADLQLEWLARSGVDEVVYAIGIGGDHIRRHVGGGERFGLSVLYVDEGDDLRGTGGALRMAFDAGVLRPWFVVMYGDALLRLDLADAVERFHASGAAALMTVYENDGRFDTSNAAFDGSWVRYDKRDPDPAMRWIDYGLLIMSSRAVAVVPHEEVVDLADVLHRLSEAGDLAGYAAHERFYEIGRPETLAELDHALRTGELVL